MNFVWRSLFTKFKIQFRKLPNAKVGQAFCFLYLGTEAEKESISVNAAGVEEWLELNNGCLCCTVRYGYMSKCPKLKTPRFKYKRNEVKTLVR